MSNAIESQGFKLEIANGSSPLAYTEVSEVTNFQLFDGQANEIDITHTQSTAKEFFMGLQDFGNCALDLNYVPTDPGQSLVRTAKSTREIQDFRVTFSDDSTAEFQAYVTSAPINGGVDAKVDTSFNLRVTGDVSFT